MGDTLGSVSFGKIDDKYVENIDDEIGWAKVSEEYYWTITLMDVRKE